MSDLFTTISPVPRTVPAPREKEGAEEAAEEEGWANKGRAEEEEAKTEIRLERLFPVLFPPVIHHFPLYPKYSLSGSSSSAYPLSRIPRALVLTLIHNRKFH